MRVTLAVLVGVPVIFAVASDRFLSPEAGIGVAALGIASSLASRRTEIVVALGMVAIALIPVYWGPRIPNTQIGLLPVFGVCAVLVPRVLRDTSAFRLTQIDWLMATYVSLRIVGTLVNSSRGAGAALDTVLYTALPYAVFRVIGLRHSIRRAAALGVVAGAVAAALFAIREYRGGGNPFFQYFPSGFQRAYWTRVDLRFNRPRPEASFGHADALGLFLALATTLAITLAWREKRLTVRIALYAAGLVCLQGISYSLVRGPFVFLLVAVPIIVLVELRHGNARQALAVIAAATVILGVTSVGAAAFRLRDASVSPGGLQDSAQDRVDTIRAMTDLRYFSWLGHDQGDATDVGAQQAIGIRTGLGAIENAFMWTYVAYGALAVAAFAAISIPIVRGAFNARLDLLDRGWSAAVVACFFIFLSVSFASQFAHFFWIALGLSAAALQTVTRDADPAPRDVRAKQLSR